MARQQGNIVRTFTQGWKPDGNHVQAVIKVLPEMSFSNSLGQVLIGGRYHTHVDRKPFFAADSADLMLLENAQ